MTASGTRNPDNDSETHDFIIDRLVACKHGQLGGGSYGQARRSGEQCNFYNWPS